MSCYNVGEDAPIMAQKRRRLIGLRTPFSQPTCACYATLLETRTKSVLTTQSPHTLPSSYSIKYPIKRVENTAITSNADLPVFL